MSKTAPFHTHKMLLMNTFPKLCLIYILLGSNKHCNIYLQNKLTTRLFSHNVKQQKIISLKLEF